MSNKNGELVAREVGLESSSRGELSVLKTIPYAVRGASLLELRGALGKVVKGLPVLHELSPSEYQRDLSQVLSEIGHHPAAFGFIRTLIDLIDADLLAEYLDRVLVSDAHGRENCPYHMSGSAVSFVNMLVMFGGMVFSPLVGRMLDRAWSGALTETGVRLFSAQDYRSALVMIPLSLLVALILALLMKETYGVGEEA